MDEFVCLTVRSAVGEREADFAARLSRFWTQLLRTRPVEFEMVYAETTKYEQSAGRLSRQYACQDGVLDLLECELAGAQIDHDPIDRDDRYSKYEIVAPEWMQIEH